MITSHQTTEMYEIMLLEIKHYALVVLGWEWNPLFCMSDNCDAIMTAFRRIWPTIVIGEIIINYMLQGI